VPVVLVVLATVLVDDDDEEDDADDTAAPDRTADDTVGSDNAAAAAAAGSDRLAVDGNGVIMDGDAFSLFLSLLPLRATTDTTGARFCSLFLSDWVTDVVLMALVVVVLGVVLLLLLLLVVAVIVVGLVVMESDLFCVRFAFIFSKTALTDPPVLMDVEVCGGGGITRVVDCGATFAESGRCDGPTLTLTALTKEDEDEDDDDDVLFEAIVGPLAATFVVGAVLGGIAVLARLVVDLDNDEEDEDEDDTDKGTPAAAGGALIFGVDLTVDTFCTSTLSVLLGFVVVGILDADTRLSFPLIATGLLIVAAAAVTGADFVLTDDDEDDDDAGLAADVEELACTLLVLFTFINADADAKVLGCADAEDDDDDDEDVVDRGTTGMGPREAVNNGMIQSD